MSRTDFSTFALRLTMVAIGSVVCAVGVNAFLVPADLLTAGVAGLAVLLSYVTPLSSGVLLFALNAPIFAAGWRWVDRDFVLWSFVGMVGLSAAFQLTAPMAAWGLVEDWYLNAGTGAIVAGIGSGLVFRARASQGGTDVVAAIVRRRRAVPLGLLLFVLNASVVAVLAFVKGLEPALATAFVILLESVVVEKTILGVDANKALLIITSRPREVADALMAGIGRGVTFLQGEGAYTGHAKQIVYCIITTRQLAHAKKIVKDLDPACFTTVHDVTEVVGKGFKQAPI
jgi:uncharacterized membrane-anchored protein YitT (DUF2179 family)